MYKTFEEYADDYYKRIPPDKHCTVDLEYVRACYWEYMETQTGQRCDTCGNPELQQSGACKICPICGTSTGCS